MSKVRSLFRHNPSRCASFSTWSKESPLSRISDRMKLVSAIDMPAAHSMRFALKPSRSALMMGIPPATAASKATMTPFCCAAVENFRSQCTASSALLGSHHMLAVGNGKHHHFLGHAVTGQSTRRAMMSISESLTRARHRRDARLTGGRLLASSTFFVRHGGDTESGGTSATGNLVRIALEGHSRCHPPRRCRCR